MKDKINFIDMNEKLDHEEIYNLIKTHSSKANKEISEKINMFKYNMDFFKFYSNEELKNLLNIFELKISENNDESFSSFKSDIEQYMSCISQIILSIKLFLKTQDILSKTIINAKNNLSKLKYENKLENDNQDYLFLYLESLFKISDKNPKFYQSATTFYSSNISSTDITPKDSLFRQFSSEYKIEHFPNDEVEIISENDNLTPRFELELDEEFENQEKKNQNLDNSPIVHDSALTLSKYIFAEEPFTPPANESKLTEPITPKPKIKNTSDERMSQINNFNKSIIKRSISSKNDKCKINKKNHFRNLLEMINKMYKKGLINSEDKLKLKKLVIEKSKKIEYLYYNIYKNLKKDKNRLSIEVKKILD